MLGSDGSFRNLVGPFVLVHDSSLGRIIEVDAPEARGAKDVAAEPR
jgi:hypothetical protein